MDILSFNRYNGWYSNPGKINMITNRVVDEAIAWNTKYHKPVLMSEYGADTVEGLHLVRRRKQNVIHCSENNRNAFLVARLRLVGGVSKGAVLKALQSFRHLTETRLVHRRIHLELCRLQNESM